MNRLPATYPGRAADPRTPARRELPAWKVTLRRWMPLAAPASYLLAAVVLAVTWAGPPLLERILSHLAGAP